MKLWPIRVARRWVKAYLCYRLEKDYSRQVPVRGFMYTNKYICLEPDGHLLINAGYEWNGCTPKFDFLGAVLGTPEGVLNPKGYPMTYFPSLVHDALYQASAGAKMVVAPDQATGEERFSRKDVDLLFYAMLREEGFKLAFFYYMAVRLWGQKSWGQKNCD